MDVDLVFTNIYKGYNVGSIPRSMMPQLDAKYGPGFRNVFNLSVVQSGYLQDFKYSQSDLNQDAIDRIARPEIWAEAKRSPIYVSEDGYIIDGHHRAVVAKMYNEPLPMMVIPMQAAAALYVLDLYIKTCKLSDPQ